ncbi:MAG: hypothetical protein NVS9B10_09970 [Nevskia sp.]
MITTTMKRRALAVAAALALAGCGRGDAPKYFPLGHGDHWEYAVTEVNTLATIERPFTIDDAGSRTRDGRHYALRRTSDGTEYWLRRDGADLLRVAQRSAVEYLPQDDAASLKIMPLAPKADDAWTITTQPFILERAVPFRERFSRDESKRFELHQRIVSLDEEVTVPAGRYLHCLRIDGEGRFNILADARIGASEVPVTQTEWYAPDIGLIKLVRTETLDTANIVGGTITMELVQHAR